MIANVFFLFYCQVVILKGNIYSGHILSYNSHYSQIYAFLFGERGLDNNPYSSLFRWLLRLLRIYAFFPSIRRYVSCVVHVLSQCRFDTCLNVVLDVNICTSMENKYSHTYLLLHV